MFSIKCIVIFSVVLNFISAEDVTTSENNKAYQFYPVSGSELHFKVRARNDAQIALSPQSVETDKLTEIVIGRWVNTNSAIRRKACSKYTPTPKAEKDTPKLLTEDEFRSFWVKWDEGVITIGKGGESSPFLTFSDPDPIPNIRYVGLHTGFGASGVWRVKDISTNVSSYGSDNEFRLETGDNVKYIFFPISGNMVRFRVRARNDVYVALATQPWETDPMYAMVIGGWYNKRSAIRRSYCELQGKDENETPQILDEKELRDFWIKWDRGVIQVGREGEKGPFLFWRDQDPFDVAYVGLRSGSSGTWQIDNGPKPPKNIINVLNDVTTSDNSKEYQYFPVSANELHFKVRARNDAHIALAPSSVESDKRTEIVIGGWSNTKSVIRQKTCSQYTPTPKAEKDTPKLLTENEFRSFWVKWDEGVITIGKGGESSPFLTFSDPDPIPNIRYVGLHTGFGATGVWMVKDISTNASSFGSEDEYHLETGDNVKYLFFPISGNMVRFRVRARNDVYVALATQPWETDPMYAMVIGGWYNTRSAIRRAYCEMQARDENKTPQYLNEEEFRGFWIRWDHDVVQVGREGERGPFLSWHDQDPFAVAYVGIHTGFGSTGTWQIQKSQSIPVPIYADCQPTLTRLRQGTACAGQVIFEENFDTLREDVWQVQQYVPIDHPELPFISYQRSTVSVRDGQLRIIPALQQIQPGFTHYSMYGALNLTRGCTSGRPSLCHLEASEGYTIIPPIIGGRITSRSNFAFTYGIITVRAKFPQGDWIYPEILLEPVINRFAYDSRDSGMIKIACARGNEDLSKGSTQYGNKVLFSGPVIDTKCHDTLLVTKTSDKAWGDDFHDYTVKWTPEHLIMSVDGTEYARVESASGGLRSRLPKTCPGPQQTGLAPFNDHYYITLGLAAGGHTQFPDGSVSSNHAKPWKNHASKATLNFWQDIDFWHDTWNLTPKLAWRRVTLESSGTTEAAQYEMAIAFDYRPSDAKVFFSGPVIDTKCYDTLLATKLSDKAWGDDFHEYTVKWTPERLIMSVNGEEYARVESASGGLRSRLPKTCPGPLQTGMAPFDDHYYITLGLAAGGHTQFPDGRHYFI